MDELAEKLGMDPLELRYKNVYREGSTTPTGQKPEVISLPEMLDILRPKYKAAMEKAAADSTDQVRKGVGISIGVYGCGLDGPDASEARIELNPDNSVTLYNTWEDHGQGADMGSLGTAHQALRPLGLKPEQIHLVMNDTSRAPNSGPAGGSRSQVVTGRAIQAACELLLDGMRKPDGNYRTYDEMQAEGIPTVYNGQWTAPAVNCDENAQGSPFSVYMYGVFMAEVAVETATGKTTVEKMTLVADIGKVNNRLVTDGQLYGGMAQGIGLALTEDFEDIRKHSTLAGAGIPYIRQIPDSMELIYVETPRPEGPFGAAGVGELPLTSPHAAVINAIYNACGVRITRLPALPEKVLAGLKK
jgi:aldehyde oxidoreductase